MSRIMENFTRFWDMFEMIVKYEEQNETKRISNKMTQYQYKKCHWKKS